MSGYAIRYCNSPIVGGQARAEQGWSEPINVEFAQWFAQEDTPDYDAIVVEYFLSLTLDDVQL